MSALSLAPFVLALVVIAGGVHCYLWNRLVKRTKLTGRWQVWATGWLWVMAVSIPAVVIVSTFVWPVIGRTFGFPAFVWMGTAFLAFIMLALIDLARAVKRSVHRVTKRPAPTANPSRRRFFARIAGGGAALTAATGTGAGLVSALKTPDVVTLAISLRRLPVALDGFSIVQLSDLHIGNTICRSWVEDIVRAANDAAGDLIVITGDLVDGSVDSLRDEAAPLAGLRAEHGVFFVTGNHDYYSGADPWIAYLGEMGIRTLRNEHVSIGTTNASFDLAGIDDPTGADHDGHGPDIATAVAGRDRARELILLAHQPKQVHDVIDHGVGLQLSGHTHGGQIWPWHFLASAQQGGLLSGLSEHGPNNATQLYVSRGTGYWGPPVRIGAPAEITRIVLRAT